MFFILVNSLSQSLNVCNESRGFVLPLILDFLTPPLRHFHFTLNLFQVFDILLLVLGKLNLDNIQFFFIFLGLNTESVSELRGLLRKQVLIVIVVFVI